MDIYLSSRAALQDRMADINRNPSLPDGYNLQRDVAVSLADNAATGFQGLSRSQGTNQDLFQTTGGYDNSGDMFHDNAVDDPTSNDEPAASTGSQINSNVQQIDGPGIFDANEPYNSHEAFGEPFGSNQGHANHGESFHDVTAQPSAYASVINRSQVDDYGYGWDANPGYHRDNAGDLYADSFLANQTADRTVGAGKKRKRGIEEEDEDEMPRAQRSRQL